MMMRRLDPAVPELPDKVEGFLSRYQGNPPVRALAQLVVIPTPVGALPLGAMADAALGALSVRADRFREERAQTFYDELDVGSAVLTPELIESEPILHHHISTVRAALNTRRLEKIRWFARLLLGTAGDRPGVAADEYEDYLAVLDELSYRELCVLATLEQFEKQFPPKPDQNEHQRVEQYWETFSELACRRCMVPAEELNPLMMRIQRSGTYQEALGSLFGGLARGKGFLTPTYARLAELIRLRDEFPRPVV